VATTAFAQFAEPALTGANFTPNTIDVGELSMLTFNFSNTGFSAIPAGSIELTISTSDTYYTSDGIAEPSGVGGALFTWTYLGTDVWRGINNDSISKYEGGNITLSVAGNNVSPGFETTNINVQVINNLSSFANESDSDNLQVQLRVGSSNSDVVCNIDISLWLEGSYEVTSNDMRKDLNEQQLLPGQDPFFFLGTATPAGQPYSVAPWNYNGTEGNAFDHDTLGVVTAGYDTDVVDWVLVSLRTSTSPSDTICRQAAWLTKDGTVTFPEACDCPLTLGQEIYIVVEHRNHLPIMTPETVTVTANGVAYDFRTQQSYITFLGDGQKMLEGGVFGMFSANGDQDNTTGSGSRTDVNATDESVWTSNNSSGDIYSGGDFDMNGDVNADDESLWLENTGKSSDVNF
jgi:hypothetical protein